MLGLSTGISQAAANLRSYVKENLKLYLDFKTHKADTLKFPCEGSTYFTTNDYVDTGDAFQSTFRGDFTISMWMKVPDGPQSRWNDDSSR